MILDDLERQNSDLYGFFGRLRTATQNRSHGGATVLALASLITRFGWNEVTLCRARLVLRWVTACGQELL